MKKGMIFGMALIIIGALGMIDSMFELGYLAEVKNVKAESQIAIGCLVSGAVVIFAILLNKAPGGVINRPY